MRKQLLLLAAILFTTATSFAVTYTVHVGNYSFIPAMLTINPGDIVTWVWDNGTHTTTSTHVPAGAAAWDGQLTSTDPTYSHTFTILGTYNYQCTFHYNNGMIGTIFVVAPTSVVPAGVNDLFTVFPNPASDKLHIQFSQSLIPAFVSLTDMTGRQLLNVGDNVALGTDINLKSIPNGTYILTAQQGEKMYRQHIVVTH